MGRNLEAYSKTMNFSRRIKDEGHSSLEESKIIIKETLFLKYEIIIIRLCWEPLILSYD